MRKEKQPFNRKAVIITGELSGEMHACELVAAVDNLMPMEWSGAGANRLREVGVRIVQDYRSISLVGITEIASKAGDIIRAYARLRTHLKRERPSLCVLVDFPGFNLPMARLAKSMHIPVVYFIPPQVWAWREKRIARMKRDVDLVISILPFEERFYTERGVNARYVGHPFMRTVRARLSKEDFLKRFGITPQRPLLVVMPGSRDNEIKRHMPILVEILRRVEKEKEGIQFLLPLAENVKEETLKPFLQQGPHVTLIKHAAYDALFHSDAAVIASGSATLEAAILDTPSVVIYKVSRLSYFLARRLVKVPYVSLPNLVAGHEVFPEFVQEPDSRKIAESIVHVLNNDKAAVKNEMAELRARLGTFDSYTLAAEAIRELIEKVYGPLL